MIEKNSRIVMSKTLKKLPKNTRNLIMKLFKLFVILLISSQNVFSQKIPSPFNTVSPNSAELVTKGVNVASNQYNGSLGVNLPVITFNHRNIEIPIELSYHSNGIRIDQRPTVVGIGWNINLGGEITRIVHGYPDEKKATKYTPHRAGYYTTSGAYIPPVQSVEDFEDYDGSYLNLRNLLNNFNGNTQDFINNYVKPNYDNKIIDLAPDEFIFNFNGISGSFFFSPDGGVKFMSKSGVQLKVEYTIQNGAVINDLSLPRAITNFKLTDNNGIQYFFGGKNAIECSYPAQDVSPLASSGQPITIKFYSPGAAVNTWKLTKIIMPNGEGIYLDYHVKEQIIDKAFINILGKIGANESFADGYDVNLSRKAVVKQCLLDSIYDTIGNKLKFNYQVSTSLGSITTYASALAYKQSSTGVNAAMGNAFQVCSSYPGLNDGTIIGDLRIAPQLYALKSITKSYNNAMIDSCLFNYRDETDKRLRLTSISKSDYLGNPRNIFQFEYNPINLPEYTSKKDDFWGFYNGNNFFDYSVEAKNYTYNKINSDFINSKQSNFDYSKAEILEKIIFETKGYQKFEYEPNVCSSILNYDNRQIEQLSSNNISGGIRLKSITEYSDADQILTQKKYHYIKNFSLNGNLSSGIQRWKTSTIDNYLKNISEWVWDFQLKPDFKKIGHDGNLVAYSEVTEEMVGNGFKTSYYENDDSILIPAGPINNGWDVQELNNFYTLRNGLLKKEEYYNKDKNKLHEKIYHYDYNNTEHLTSISFLPPIPDAISSGDMLIFVNYVLLNENYTNNVYTHNPLLISVVTNDLHAGNIITSTQNFEYDVNSKLIKKESILNSNNQTSSVDYKYPYDFPSSSIYQEMVSRNLIAPVIEEINSVNNIQTKLTRTNFDQFDFSGIYPKNVEVQLGSGPLQTKTSFYRYDAYGNILEKQDGNSALKEVYLWSYKSQYPIAKIVGNDFTTIKSALGGDDALLSFSSTVNPDKIAVDSFLAPLKSALPYTQMISYTHKPLVGVLSMTDIKGLSTYYEYDGFQRLAYVRDQHKNIIKSYCYNYAGQMVDCNQLSIPTRPFGIRITN
ncbi:hypothetical protein SRABI126_04874 [Pedobacter sp. Bi126]|nr:hypothetical protein SRABI126_04874 [Pedobacter sp. Bi126]